MIRSHLKNSNSTNREREIETVFRFVLYGFQLVHVARCIYRLYFISYPYLCPYIVLSMDKKKRHPMKDNFIQIEAKILKMHEQMAPIHRHCITMRLASSS